MISPTESCWMPGTIQWILYILRYFSTFAIWRWVFSSHHNDIYQYIKICYLLMKTGDSEKLICKPLQINAAYLMWFNSSMWRCFNKGAVCLYVHLISHYWLILSYVVLNLIKIKSLIIFPDSIICWTNAVIL